VNINITYCRQHLSKFFSYLKDDLSHAFFETCFKVLAALMPEERKYKNLTDFLK